MAENKDLTPFKYEEVQKSLFKTLKLDSFIQFLKSQEYANYFIEHVPTDIAPLIINEFKEILSKLQQPRYQVIKTFFIVLFKTLNMEKNEIGLSNLVSSITPVIFQTTPTEEMDYKAKTLITKFFITNVLKIFDIDENFLKENMENNTNGENSNIIIKVPLKKSKNKKDKDKNKGHTDDVDEKSGNEEQGSKDKENIKVETDKDQVGNGKDDNKVGTEKDQGNNDKDDNKVGTDKDDKNQSKDVKEKDNKEEEKENGEKSLKDSEIVKNENQNKDEIDKNENESDKEEEKQD